VQRAFFNYVAVILVTILLLFRDFFVLLCKTWIYMAIELQETLTRIISKSKVMVEKYHAIVAAKAQTDKENAEVRAENEKLRIEIERVKRENEYLRMAHSIAPTPETVAKSKSMISKIVRDIDKCINQLNA